MEKLFLSVLNMSLTGAYVIAAIMLARLPLKKAPKVISYALWIVAGFRLAFPFSLSSVFSLLPFNAAPIPQDIAMQAVPRFNSGVTAIDNAISAVLPAAAPAASANPLQLWQFVGAYVWLFGIAVMLIYSVISIALLQHRLRGAAHVEGNLYEADNLKTPFVLGLFRPKIYLPSGLSMDERRYIILHERTHIRRYDHIVKMLAYFALCLHWFNPLVWAAFVLMGADMEMSCDERVMRELGSDIKTAYSLSLVRVAAGHRILNGSPLAFGEGGMKERVKNVLNFKKHSRVIIIAAVALAAVVITGFSVNKTTEARKTPGKYQPQVWLDYYLSKEFPSGDTTAGRTFPEFPGVEFIWMPGKLVAKDAKGERELLFGMPIWNIYMADLTGDGLPEFCATVSFGSGVIDNHIVVYDYAADQTYTLSDRMYYDYALFLDHTRLTVMQTKYPNPKGDVLATGELAIVNGELVAIGIPNDVKSLTEQRQSRLTAYLSDLFTTAYAPFYEALRYEVSGYEEVADASGSYSATFLWTMYHKGNGLDAPSDLSKEQEANFLLQATAKLDAEGLPDLNTIEILADGSATGARDYRVPIADFFPDGEAQPLVGGLPDFKPENLTGVYDGVFDGKAYGGIFNTAIISKYSDPNFGFLVYAPTIHDVVEEEGKLRAFVTVYYKYFRLADVTLTSEGGGVIPAAITFRQGENGGWVQEAYTAVGDSPEYRDGAYFANSIEKLCVTPSSGKPVEGLAQKILKDYSDHKTRSSLLLQSLTEHLMQYGRSGVSLIHPDGSVEQLT